MYLPARNEKKIIGCSGRPSVGREIWGPDFPLKSGLHAERSGSKSKLSGAVSGTPVSAAKR